MSSNTKLSSREKLALISEPWEGRERFKKRVKFRKKYRSLIRIKNLIHLYWLIFKDYINK